MSAPCLFPRLKVPLHQGKGGAALAVKEAQEGKRRAKERAAPVAAEERSVRAPPLGRSQSHGRTREEEARQHEARIGRRKQGALSERTPRTDRRSEGPLNGERNLVPKRSSLRVCGDSVQADTAEATSKRSTEQVSSSRSNPRVEPCLLLMCHLRAQGAWCMNRCLVFIVLVKNLLHQQGGAMQGRDDGTDRHLLIS